MTSRRRPQRLRSGRTRRPDATPKQEKNSVIVCDFCSAEDPRWRYPARNFSQQIREGHQVGGFNSRGGWAACDKCSALIEATDRDGLANRSYENVIVKYPPMPLAHRQTLRRRIRELHDTFWSSREGPRQQVDIIPPPPDPQR